MMHPVQKERALTAPCAKPVASTATRPLPSTAQRTAQPAYRFPNGTVDDLIVEALQETVQRREIGHAGKPQALTQFAMLAEPHLGLAKGPIFVAHQAKNGQQLRLGKLLFAEAASVARRHPRETCRAMRAKGKSPTSAIAPAASIAKHRFLGTCDCGFSWL
jgi:hypothetical protein